MSAKKLLCLSVTVVFAFMLFACGGGSSDGTSGGEEDNGNGTQPPPYRIYGLDFSAYTRPGQDPNSSTIIAQDQIREHLKIVAPYTRWVRTFGSSLGMEDAARIAREFGLKTAIGAWLSTDLLANDKEMANLIDAAQAGDVDLAIIGSEVLYRGDLDLPTLLGYIERFRKAVPGVPVTTADTCDMWLAYPELFGATDVILSNYYPYWLGTSIDQAMVYVHKKHQQIVALAQGKEVIVSETGWPGAGDTIGQAVASPENAAYYFLDFASWAQAENVNFFYFEAFDEPWKAAYEGEQGAHWGVWDKDGNLKPGMSAVFDGQVISDNWTTDCLPGGTGTALIELTNVPPVGSTAYLEGRASHVYVDSYGVAVYIYVNGWWTKPYWSDPVTELGCDGYFACNITTGGSDELATKVAAFLIALDYDPPSMSGGSTLPNELFDNAVDYVIVDR